MKYNVTRVNDIEGVFKPFNMTLTFETEEEYVFFHDVIMSKLTQASIHDFHRFIYLAGNGENMISVGEI